jgi:cyclohexyl-isocyanide hydratase
MVLFPRLTQLDLTAPYEVFARMPDTRVHLVAADLTPVVSEYGLTITPEMTFEQAPPLDILFVPGGIGVNPMMEDRDLLRFLQTQAQQARYVTSVCTGALLLGAAGLLRGYRATTHWLSLDLLPLFGAEVAHERVVVDRNRITGGGVTAGIDFGLAVAAEIFGAAVAQEIQLTIEYGSRDTVPADVVERVVQARRPIQLERWAIAERAAARLAIP